MSNKMLYGKNLEAYDELDIDDLLSKLTEDEINELNEDLDPDNSLLPPHQRCKDQTKKTPTGKFDREKLIKAKEEPDWSDLVPFEKKIRGKVFTKPDPAQISKDELNDLGFDTEFDDEVSEILAEATEEQLVDLAAILGFTGMLNQIQYHAGLENKTQESGGFNGVAKSDKLKVFDELPPNNTDVEESIKKLEENNSSLTVLNLNNIKEISPEQFERLARAILSNKNLKELHMASTDMNNTNCEHFLEVLEKNDTLQVINFESNFLSGEMLIKIVRALQSETSKIKEIHLTNQSQKTLGVQVEDMISKLVRENPRIVRFGLDFESLEAKVKMREYLRDSMDKNTRQERIK